MGHHPHGPQGWMKKDALPKDFRDIDRQESFFPSYLRVSMYACGLGFICVKGFKGMIDLKGNEKKKGKRGIRNKVNILPNEAPLPNPASSKNSNSIRSSSLAKPDMLEEDDGFDKIERSVFTVSLVSKPVIIEELLPLADEEEEGRRALKEEYEETNMSSINTGD